VDVDDFARLNEVYARPAARPICAGHVKLRRGLLMSIDAVAVPPAG
jgi:hypothetical protein